MIRLVEKLKENGFEIILLSDANSLFAEDILKRNGILHSFAKIFTNPAEVTTDGLIQIKPFYEGYNDFDRPFECEQCLRECGEPSICKGRVLDDQIEALRPKQVFYFGDGSNDYCAGLVLGQTDYLFVRKEMHLAKMLQNADNLVRLKSKVRYWQDAQEILQQIDF